MTYFPTPTFIYACLDGEYFLIFDGYIVPGLSKEMILKAKVSKLKNCIIEPNEAIALVGMVKSFRGEQLPFPKIY